MGFDSKFQKASRQADCAMLEDDCETQVKHAESGKRPMSRQAASAARRLKATGTIASSSCPNNLDDEGLGSDAEVCSVFICFHQGL